MTFFRYLSYGLCLTAAVMTILAGLSVLLFAAAGLELAQTAVNWQAAAVFWLAAIATNLVSRS